MRSNSKRAILSAAACAAALSSAAFAGVQPRGIDLTAVGPGAVMRAVMACAPDARSLCADVAPGGGRVAACLADQYELLSAPCAGEVDKAALLREAVFACAPDIDAFCSTTQPGGGRILSCLAGNQDRLTAPCFYSLSDAVEAYGG